MDSDTFLIMLLRHGARLEKIEEDIRYLKRRLQKIDLATQEIQKDINVIKCRQNQEKSADSDNVPIT